jgi:hypothetical protein
MEVRGHLHNPAINIVYNNIQSKQCVKQSDMYQMRAWVHLADYDPR